MGKEIVISSESNETRIAIVENGRLAEMYVENPDNERTLGDIYLGRVRRIMPSIQAAFVDIGQKSDAFLHFSDIADNLPDISTFLALKEPEVSKVELQQEHSTVQQRRKPHHRSNEDAVDEADDVDDGKDDSSEDDKDSSKKSRLAKSKSRGQRRSAQHRAVKKSDSGQSRHHDRPRPESLLKRDQPILVKIVKEPISAKGSRISTDISLAGRFVVLVPLADYVAVSKKIQSFKERRRLRALAKSLLPPGFGIIVRTVAEGKNAQALDTDLSLLVDKWRKIEKKLSESPKPPVLLHQDVNMVSSVIRDLFSDNYDRILIGDQKMYRNIKGYVQAVAPDMVPAVHMYKGDKTVFEAAKIAKEAAQAFEKRVDLPSGGYLIIEHTEAMHVIDVNSGRAGKGLSQEDNSLKVNLESAKLVAQQLRLRDLGGIIVIDFIDLRDDKNRRKVYDELKKQFRKDRAVTKILPMSDFGLMQITRQRMRPSITTQVSNANGKADDVSLEKSHLASDDEKQPRSERRRRKEIDPEQMVAKVESWLKRYRENGSKNPLVLKVHPFTAAFLTKPTPSIPTRWFFKYRTRIKLSPEPSMDPGQYRFFDAKTGKNLSRGRSKFNKGRKDRQKGGQDAGQKSDPKSEQKTDQTAKSHQKSSSKSGSRPQRGKPRNSSSDSNKSRNRPQRKNTPNGRHNKGDNRNQGAGPGEGSSTSNGSHEKPAPDNK